MENKNTNTNTNAAFTPTAKQIFKHEHPFLFLLLELVRSFYLCLGIAAIATIMMASFHFVFGLEWGDSLLACLGTTLSVFCIWFLCWSFSYKEKGKWLFRILAVIITAMFIVATVIYVGYIRPTYGA